MDVTQLGLVGQTVKNVRLLACKFELDQSERKSSQVNARARNAWPNGVASRPRFSTCVHLQVRLKCSQKLHKQSERESYGQRKRTKAKSVNNAMLTSPNEAETAVHGCKY